MAKKKSRNLKTAPSAGPPAQPKRAKARNVGLAIALGVFALAAYSNSFSSDLVLDSAVLIKQDPRLRDATADNVANILRRPYWWPSIESDLYRPVTTMTYLVNYSVLGNGDRPAGYHVVNLMLHWLNACLVKLIVRSLSGRDDVSFLAAALFALHPIATEAVTNIAGRADLLATLSILLGTWCFLRADATDRSGRVFWLVAFGVSACWGVFAKESGVMVAAVPLLHDWIWRRRFQWAGYAAVAPALLAFWIIRSRLAFPSSVFSQVFVDNPIIGATGWLQAKMTAFKVVCLQLALLVYPGSLSVDYSYNQIPLFGAGGRQDAIAWFGVAAVAALIAAAVVLRSRLPLVSWGIAFLLVMMLPTSNLILTIGSIMAERFLYLPAVGFCVVAALFVLWIGSKAAETVRLDPIHQRRVSTGIAVLVLVAFGVRTYARNSDWQNERTLWASAQTASPRSFKPYKGSANAVWANGAGTGEAELDSAIALAERGLAILDRTPLPIEHQDNTVFIDLGVYYRFKGEFLAKRNQIADARRYFQKAVDILVRARAVDAFVNDTSRKQALERGRPANEIPDTGNYNVYVQLAAANLDLNNWAEAEAGGLRAMSLQPLNIDGYRAAAIARLNQGRAEEASLLYVAIVTLQPQNTGAWNELGFCFKRMGLQPVPIVQNGSRFSLDEGQPAIRRMINEAAALIVRELIAAGQAGTARTYQQDFIQRLRVPPQSFGR
jgi:tetratricopeptide (TPR) repeat protein